jgi:predicted O-methyltransferase YrrM
MDNVTQFSKIKYLLHGDLDLYENFEYTEYENTLSPGSMPANEILSQVVEDKKPSLIIEVGSFLGWSAYGMSSKMKELNPDGVTICVDSWMGGSDHWESTVFGGDNRIQRKNGYPTFYYNFLANMCYMGMQETVIPFAYPSVTAADILQTVMKRENLFADMIYIDGSHLYLDVLLDLQNYWPLLKDGGVMFGDDWTCPDVREAVLEFVQENKYPLTIHPNQVHWFIDKTVFKPINLT